ncbi:MAG: N-acetylneuraminate synthase family protein [Saprospiraceae bacterium]|nr:N-acetylneuraminate synthase family protein [Saprospiraceae bacterium]
MNTITLKNGRKIGPGEPCFIIAEIGINHNGDLGIAKRLIEEAAAAGCDAVKFQKRTPEICTPRDEWDRMRDTPWGRMRYIDYRYKVEFGVAEYAEIDRFAREKGIVWFASCWDQESVDFLEQFDPMLYKAASASLTDIELLNKKKNTGKPLIISTGMSTQHQIDFAVEAIGQDNLLIAHSTSAYPCPAEELNLKMIHTLQEKFPGVPIGYSGHETGLATTYAAVAMGACFVERHYTLDRAMWGSDQAASVEIEGMRRMVRDIRDIEKAMGNGIKQVYESEMGAMKKLRKFKDFDLISSN